MVWDGRPLEVTFKMIFKMGSVYTGTHKEREDHKQGHGEKGLGEWVASLTGARMRAKSHGEVV